MARIAGVNIPTNKRVLIALQYIHGIGSEVRAGNIEKAGIPAERRVNELSDAQVIQIREIIDRDYMVEGDLRRKSSMNIKRLMDLGYYRGLRHRRVFPSAASDAHQCAYPQRSGQTDCRQKETRARRVIPRPEPDLRAPGITAAPISNLRMKIG